MNTSYGILRPLSEFVREMADWELVEYASRYEVTNQWSKNGATEAKIKAVMLEWKSRYPEEEIPILECVPPLNVECTFSEYRPGENDEK